MEHDFLYRYHLGGLLVPFITPLVVLRSLLRLISFIHLIFLILLLHFIYHLGSHHYAVSALPDRRYNLVGGAHLEVCAVDDDAFAALLSPAPICRLWPPGLSSLLLTLGRLHQLSSCFLMDA